jgi:SepF-like predicted cell division protein (DUF552 family)
MGFFDKLKEKFGTTASDVMEDTGEGYVELGSDSSLENKGKITVRPFIIEDFEHIKPILDSLREGRTIALINIKPLKDRDIIELKRAINKLKKTCDAIGGDIAGFGENWIAAVPQFGAIYRPGKEAKQQPEQAKDTGEMEYKTQE